MSAVMKPKVEYQGKFVVERDGDVFLVMAPNGDIGRAATPKHVERICKQWFKKHISKGAIGVGQIEWRDGIKPPSSPNLDSIAKE